MTPTPRDWLLLFGLGVIWGAAFMATKLATADFAPLTIAGLRLGVAASTLTAVMWLRGARFPGRATPRQRKFWLAALAVGILANVAPFTTLIPIVIFDDSCRHPPRLPAQPPPAQPPMVQCFQCVTIGGWAGRRGGWMGSRQ